jgi:phosphoribosylglycinamide formyltransferase-1
MCLTIQNGGGAARRGASDAVIETGDYFDPTIVTLLDTAELLLERGPVGLAVLISGSGRSLENLLHVIARGNLNGSVRVVVSSKQNVRGLEIARDAGIPALVIQRRDYDSDLAYSDAIYDAIVPYEAELILLAGFLRKLVVPEALAGRILNIHPALLPEAAAAAGQGFYGERVHAAVLASGASRSGATVHVVDNGYDTGPVVMRATVPVLPDDTPETLASRVFVAECALYPAAIKRYIASHPELFGV